MQTLYVVSSGFPYRALIARDAGPGFAADYQWQTVALEELRDHNPDVTVVDNRLRCSDLDILKTCIAGSKSIFVLKICDPYWEHAQHHFWYKFAAEMIDHERVHYLLNYQPAEITGLLWSKARRSRFIFAPYVYDASNEVLLQHETRQRALLFSGALSSSLYPLRAQMRRTARYYPPLRIVTKTLPHPGYPDLSGRTAQHGIVGDAYLNYLSGFRFAAICSSRCRLEFLKYREFAYAGVVPVGNMPSTLLDCPTEAYLPWRRNFIALTNTLLAMRDSEARAQKFRAFMRERRDAATMRQQVNHELARLA